MSPRLRAARLAVEMSPILLFLMLAPLPARADWLPNGNPPSSVLGNRDLPRVTSDGEGGAFVAWWDGAKVVAQHFTGVGDYASGWPSAGKVVVPWYAPYPYFWNNLPAAITSDEAAGAYVVSFRGGYCPAHCGGDPLQLYVQRITASGSFAPGWPSAGVPIEHTWEPHMYEAEAHGAMAVPDGSHGVFVAWQAFRSPRIIIQSVGPDGSVRWGDDGLLIALGTVPFTDPSIVADENGGLFVFWGGSLGIYGQHVSAAGRPLWQPGGRLISKSALVQVGRPAAASDGARGALVAWAGSSGSGFDIYAARITHGGSLPWGGDLRISRATGDQTSVVMAPAAGGDAIIAWLDSRGAPAAGVYAQRVTHGGRTMWAADGVPVCAAPGVRYTPAIASDGADGAYLTWGDSRPEGELYATRLTGAGAPGPGWPEDGALLCQRPQVTFAFDAGFRALSLVPTGRGRAIVAWDDTREGLVHGGGDYDAAFVTLLKPDGPAGSPLAADPSRGPSRVLSNPRPSGRSVFALHGMEPNPGRRGSLIRLALPDGAPARLELFDAAGRRLWSREVSGLGPGEYEVRLGDGAWFPPGVYLARLSQGDHAATARVAIVR